ncbi:MAG: glycoside hydrolase family 97 protein, partial [Chitinophagaceae bacterium]
MRRALLGLGILLNCIPGFTADRREVFSPDKKIRLAAEVNDSIYYSVYHNGSMILEPSVIDMLLSDGTRISDKLAIRRSSVTFHKNIITSPVPEKRKYIPDVYNELSIRLRQPFSIIFRVYDDGVAYRIVSHYRDSITIMNEKAVYRFPANHLLYYPEVVKRENADSFHTSFEEPYQIKPLDSING